MTGNISREEDSAAAPSNDVLGRLLACPGNETDDFGASWEMFWAETLATEGTSDGLL